MQWPARVQVTETEVPGPVRLRAWLVTPEGPTVGQAVLVHGWGTERSRMATLAGTLALAGYGCLVPDLRGHGASPGDGAYFVDDLLEDLDAIRAWFETASNAPAPAVLGHSFAGLGALLSLAAGRGWSTVVALASPSSAMRAIASYFQSLGWPPILLPLLRPALRHVTRTDVKRYDLCDFLPGATEPALAIHGTRDTVVCPSELERLRRCVPGSLLRCEYAEGEDHDSVLQSGRVSAMILEHLRGLSSSG